LFSDSTVDPGTGQVTLRGEFPNPNLRVQIVQRITRGAATGRPPQQCRRQ
jgi:hypothetical protein